MRVLLVEDHEELAETVAAGLRREGMAVDLALDGPTALERARSTVTTSSSSTVICPASTATRCAGRWRPGAVGRGC